MSTAVEAVHQVTSEAIQRSESNANPDFMTFALESVRVAATLKKEITIDDVREVNESYPECSEDSQQFCLRSCDLACSRKRDHHPQGRRCSEVASSEFARTSAASVHFQHLSDRSGYADLEHQLRRTHCSQSL
jgi:hypothetical protein